jgi:hypothetical protein
MLDDVWRHKTDEQILAAVQSLSEYTEPARAVILKEVQRRQAAGAFSGLVDVAVDVTIPDREPTTASPRRLIGRLWRGEIPLATPFWGFGVVFPIAFRAVIIMSLSLGTSNAVGWFVLCLALAYVGFVAFGFIVVWRSAGRYTGDSSWRHLARLIVVLNVLAVLVNLFVSRPR